MHRLASSDLDSAISRFPYAHKGSLMTLGSRFGMSRSELSLWLDGDTHGLWADFDAGWMVELQDIDTSRATLRFHLHCVAQPSDLQHALAWIVRLNVTKAYCYVFAWEEAEQCLLASAGFEREAVFREHVRAGNAYADLVVYGLLLEAR